MADSLARLIVTLEAQTLSYQKGMENAQNQLAKFQSRQSASLGQLNLSFEKFSKGVNQILRGGGILIGFKALTNQLDAVAQKFSGLDSAANTYLRTQKLLSQSMDNAWLKLLQAIAPAVKAIGDFMDPAALATRRLAVATEELKEAEDALNKARSSNRSGLNAPDLSQLQKERDEKRSNLVAAQASNKRTNGLAGADSSLDLFFQNESKAQKAAVEEVSKALDNMFEREHKQSQQAVADWNEQVEAAKRLSDLFANADEIDTNPAFEQMKKDEHDLLVERLRANKEVYDAQEKLQIETAEKAQQQAQAFGDLLVDNLVQAADTGFKSMLESFARTLQQMVLRAAATKLFEKLFSNSGTDASGGGGFLAMLGGLLSGGRAGGGPVLAGHSYLVGERGPEILRMGGVSGNITPNGAGGNVVVNQTISVGAGVTPPQLIAAMKLAKDSAKAEIRDDLNRRR